VKLAVFVSDEVPEIVMGDPGRFRQIVTNLVGNSVKVSGSLKLYYEILTTQIY
jgi:signal transduction histidine kinase